LPASFPVQVIHHIVSYYTVTQYS